MRRKTITLDEHQLNWLLAILEDAEENVYAAGIESEEEVEEYSGQISSIFDAVDNAEWSE